jgi:hypothetical protein
MIDVAVGDEETPSEGSSIGHKVEGSVDQVAVPGTTKGAKEGEQTRAGCPRLRFVVAPGPTPASALLLPRRLAGLTGAGHQGAGFSRRGGQEPDVFSAGAQAAAAIGSGTSAAQEAAASGQAMGKGEGDRKGVGGGSGPQPHHSALEVSAVGMAMAEALALRIASQVASCKLVCSSIHSLDLTWTPLRFAWRVD